VTAQKNLADILLETNQLTKEQYDLVKFELANTGKPIEDIIIAHQFVDEEKIIQAKSVLYNIPYISILTTGISPEALSLIPEPVAKRYVLIPFSIDRKLNALYVAMSDPLDIQVLEFIERKSGLSIKPYFAIPIEIERAINKQYSAGLTSEVGEVLKQTQPAKTPQSQVDLKTARGDVIREAPVAKIVSTILEYAMKARASDVHVEPMEDYTRVRFRIDGILKEKLTLPKKIHDAVVSRIKILCQLKIDEKRIPQDGRFSFQAGEEEIDLRVSTLPTVFGEKVVMRLLKKSGGVPDLPDLGLRGLALKHLEVNMLRPHGVILITGPTGSGKTTTLYSILSRLNTKKVNIITLEDPVEYQIEGVNQVQINPAANLTFASGLRSILRQDPNIIMVGEIRDKETTELAIQASLTGHLVFSTLHTNDASGALPRLLDMGAEAFLIASTVNCVIAQRVCRRICPHCKKDYQPPTPVIEDMKKVLGKLFDSFQITHKENKGNTILYKGEGCKECDQSGYLGRIGIFEVLPISDLISKLILEHASSHQIEAQAIKEGMISMKQDGYIKALEGTTSIEEVIRVAQE